MTESQKLHTAARRHCIEECAQPLHTFLIDLSPQEQQETKARYFLLEAIELEVERFDFDALPALPELRELLVLSAAIATPFLQTSDDEITRQTERETRAEFAQFIENFNATSAVEPLPYRRVLYGEAMQAVAKILKGQWGTTPLSYFHPLDHANSAHAATYFAYDAVAFEAAFPDEKFAELLCKHGIERVYELREWGEENYLQDVELINPSYTGAEVFISSAKWDWLFYASHELSITTAGWLTEAIQDEWPQWEQAKYHPTWWQ